MRCEQQGIGLPEILISLFLSALITTALFNHYLRVKQNYRYTSNALEDAVDLLQVTDLLRDSIKRAGFSPCLGIEQLITGSPKLLAFSINTGPSSVLKINRMSEYYDSVLNVISPTELLLTKSQSLNRHHPVLIADCYHAEVQYLSRINHANNAQYVTLNTPLLFNYQMPIYIGEWIQETFFIRTISPHKTALFYKNIHTDELTNVVHSMTITPSAQPGFLQIKLGLSNGQEMTLETSVRAPL